MSSVSEQRASCSQNTDLIARYRKIRDLTARLADPLTAEDQMVQSAVETSPTKWHLAHTSWFFETFVLQPHMHGYRSFNERFSYLFNSYYKQLEMDIRYARFAVRFPARHWRKLRITADM